MDNCSIQTFLQGIAAIIHFQMALLQIYVITIFLQDQMDNIMIDDDDDNDSVKVKRVKQSQ